jgi:hypothetical protein
LTFDVLINSKDIFDVLKFLDCRRSEIRRSDLLPINRTIKKVMIGGKYKMGHFLNKQTFLYYYNQPNLPLKCLKR